MTADKIKKAFDDSVLAKSIIGLVQEIKYTKTTPSGLSLGTELASIGL